MSKVSNGFSAFSKAMNVIKVHSSQAVRLPPMQHQTVLIPSTSQPSWGGYSSLI